MSGDRILVTGAGGLLGPYLVDALRRAGQDVVPTALASGDRPCDLTDAAAVARLVGEVAPSCVIHAAAYTDVDGCERDEARADALNRGAVENLVRALPKDTRLVQISTDQVYPDRAGLHREDDVAPVNAYGRSKLAGEKAALAHHDAVVLRVNFFGASRTAGRKSLSDFVVESLRAQKKITLFEDVLFSPLHAETLADVIVVVAQSGLSGAYNVACRDGTSKADFGLAVARGADLSTETVTIGSSSSVETRAPRPRDLRMDPSKLEAALGKPMPTLAHEIALL